MWNRRLIGRMVMSLGVIGLLVAAPAATAATLYSTDFNSFGGSGFAPGASGPLLDSNSWIATGVQGVSMNFGDTQTSGGGVFARGTFTTSGSGGVYAGTLGAGDKGLVAQPWSNGNPTFDVFQPGGFTLRVPVANGATSLAISYDTLVYNGKDASETFNFGWSNTNGGFTTVTSENVVTPATADVSPAWASRVTHTVTIPLINITEGYAYFRWNVLATGLTSGPFDAVALDNVTVATAVPEPATLGLLMVGAIAAFRRR